MFSNFSFVVAAAAGYLHRQFSVVWMAGFLGSAAQLDEMDPLEVCLRNAGRQEFGARKKIPNTRIWLLLTTTVCHIINFNRHRPLHKYSRMSYFSSLDTWASISDSRGLSILFDLINLNAMQTLSYPGSYKWKLYDDFARNWCRILGCLGRLSRYLEFTMFNKKNQVCGNAIIRCYKLDRSHTTIISHRHRWQWITVRIHLKYYQTIAWII